MRLTRFRVLLILAVSSLALCAAIWVFWVPPLSADEAALVGEWHSPVQPDGSSTTVILNSNRTCRVRWLDAAGNDDPASPPQHGRWRVAGGKLYVDTRRTTGVALSGDDVVRNRSGHTWDFAVVDGGLVHGPDSDKPLHMRRGR